MQIFLWLGRFKAAAIAADNGQWRKRTKAFDTEVEFQEQCEWLAPGSQSWDAMERTEPSSSDERE